MSEKKKASILFPVILIGAVVLVLGGYAVYVKNNPKKADAPASTAASTVTPPAPTDAPKAEPTKTIAESVQLVPTKVLTGPAPEPSIPVETSTDPLVNAMMANAKLGSDDAPIKVVEYSSLTCGHCASFHQNDFPRIKTDYIDTGKVQFIFKEFPLNKPAVDASKILRCLPRERFVNFMSLLFNEQSKWAYQEDYLTPLKQNAKLAGLSESDINSCLNNKELENRLIGDMKRAGDVYKIQSTPSFVINDGLKTLSGHQPFGFFKETFDTLLNGAPSTTTETAPSAAMPDMAAPAAVSAPATSPATPETK